MKRVLNVFKEIFKNDERIALQIMLHGVERIHFMDEEMGPINESVMEPCSEWGIPIVINNDVNIYIFKNKSYHLAIPISSDDVCFMEYQLVMDAEKREQNEKSNVPSSDEEW